MDEMHLLHVQDLSNVNTCQSQFSSYENKKGCISSVKQSCLQDVNCRLLIAEGLSAGWEGVYLQERLLDDLE